MTREIKFRGKRLSDDEWIYGDLLHNVDCVKIREWEADVNQIAKSYVVDDKTVGQFTGLKDKNGRNIYEGDIIKTLVNEIVIIRFGEFVDSKSHSQIGFYKKIGCDECWVDSNYGNIDYVDENCEVIGNTHDNPELLLSLIFYHPAITRKERKRKRNDKRN
jgi:uncharacterized phage protein (TIGR01671 family)